MTIENDHVVTIEYTVTGSDGNVIDTSAGRAPLAYLHGKRNIVSGLEKALSGKRTGDEFKVIVTPAEGYGERNEGLISIVPVADLAEIPDLEVGIQLQAQTPQGFRVLTVKAIENGEVTLDGNHPLAGETLNFAVKVVSIRLATKEELQHGHVHGPGGHQH
ncbi:MAG: peptidylprolyl isomerase [Proteobacteria bacterium SG_bin7]|nr:MAG: peptidylprolyl isomerase [Proteobacteria bacterium SG_bin7]